jgi:hypothetical protein
MHYEDCDVMLLVETHSVSEGLVASIFRVLVYPEWRQQNFPKNVGATLPNYSALLSTVLNITHQLLIV